MYCSCKDPKKKVNDANGIKFEVCSKSLGGCGKEIRKLITTKSAKVYVNGIEVAVATDVKYELSSEPEHESISWELIDPNPWDEF